MLGADEAGKGHCQEDIRSSGLLTRFGRRDVAAPTDYVKFSGFLYGGIPQYCLSVALYLEIVRRASNLVTAFQRTCLDESWQFLKLQKTPLEIIPDTGRTNQLTGHKIGLCSGPHQC
jgi:hypothetical protein